LTEESTPLDRHKMARHFEVEIGEAAFAWWRKPDKDRSGRRRRAADHA
jgi:hypothetical protein